MDLFKKKKKIKTMNAKMAINTDLSTIEAKKQTKQTRRTERIMDTENVFMVARWEGVLGEWVRRWGDKEVQIGSYRIAMGM